jgi:uncharacterized protein (DUF1684 family)
MYRLLIGLLGFLVLGSSTYENSILDWQQQRDKSLRSENGWLTLVGLFWLKPGDNTIGSANSNDFVLPKGSAPEHAGTLRLEGDKVTFIKSDGSSHPLQYKEEAKPEVVQTGSVSFFVIKRGDKLAVRAKDNHSPALKHFAGMKYFPINPALHFDAKFVPDSKKIPILNILGQTDLEESPGVVEFTYKGNQYHLRPIYEGKTLFFLFKDPTNKVNTYQAGRMLNTPLPENGRVDLDFNRSYNPPCTFTPYATCPLPPKENTLPFAVEAGEMRYGNGHAAYDTP